MTGYLVVRLAPLLRLLPGVELRVGDNTFPADLPVSLPPGPATVRISVALASSRGSLEARIDVPVWIDPVGTTVVDLARLAHLFAGCDPFLPRKAIDCSQ